MIPHNHIHVRRILTIWSDFWQVRHEAGSAKSCQFRHGTRAEVVRSKIIYNTNCIGYIIDIHLKIVYICVSNKPRIVQLVLERLLPTGEVPGGV